MKIIKEAIPGTLLIDGEVAALRHSPSQPDDVVYLSYALATLGPGYRILPSVLLDDWGTEVDGLALYGWINENGRRFPRAEVFGVDPAGAQVQYFLRDLELLGGYPAYAFTEANAPASAGVPLRAILIPDDATVSAYPISPPDDVAAPLREAQVEWWRVNPGQTDLAFLHRSPLAPES